MSEVVTIVRIIDRLNIGGPAIHAVLTSQRLDRGRFRTVLVHGTVEPNEGDMGYLLDGESIERVVIPELGRELRPLRDLTTAWQLYRVLRQERPLIVHTHKSKAGAIGRVVALLARVPIRIHTYHGHVYHGYFGAAKTRLFLAIERVLARVTTRLIALSSDLAEELATKHRIGRRDRYHVIRLGFDLAPFASCERRRGELRKSLGIDRPARIITIVGRMVPIKDHATFIRAAEILAARQPDLHFVLAGGGELEPQVRDDVERRGLTARVHLLGWVRDLPAIYADSDVVVLTSLNEGTPVALIEAMASGVSVVGTSVGGVGDVLGHGARGELVAPRDAEALACAIERALEPTARERAGRVRPDIIAEYGSERLCTDLARLYEELLRTAR